jgi:hypothetical protein
MERVYIDRDVYVTVDRADPLTMRVFECTTTYKRIQNYPKWVISRDVDMDIALERVYQHYTSYYLDVLRRNYNWFAISSNRNAYDKWCQSYSYLFGVYKLALPSYELFLAVLKLKLEDAKVDASSACEFSVIVCLRNIIMNKTVYVERCVGQSRTMS